MGLWNAIKMICKGTIITTKVAVTGVRVAGHLATSTLRGTAATLTTVNQALNKASNKDWDGLEDLLATKAEQIGQSFDKKLQLAAELEEEVYSSMEDKSHKFFTKQNAKRIAGVISIGGLVAGGISASDALDMSDVTDTDVLDNNDIDSEVVTYALNGMTLAVNNGVFDGDDNALETLISMGEVENTNHIESEDIRRDTAARDRFLHMHDLNSVPDGYEVHHIVPICEGGADTPENMILVREEEHARITAEHARYYGWHS